MKTVYCLTFPIENYKQDGIFEKNVYIHQNGLGRSPSFQEMKRILVAAHEEEIYNCGPEFKSICHEYKDCITCLDNIQGVFPVLTGNLVQTNCFVETKYGKYPLSAKKLIIHSFCEEGKTD